MTDDRPDGVVALSRWRAVLARSRNPRKRLDLLMDDPLAASLVPRIPVEEFYYLVRAVGLEDSIDVLRLASTEQLQGCLDLDLWDRDRLSTPRVLAWLEVLAELSPSVLARTIHALDIELIALVLGKHARVYDRTVGEAPDDESTYVVHRTADAAFVVEFRTSNATAARTLETFIMRLYDGDPDLARALLTEAKWGTTAELEEASYRWRVARLADLGFPSYEDALAVYREVKPSAPVVSSPASSDLPDVRMLPVPFAEALGGDSLLERALFEIDDADLMTRLSAALVGFLNSVLVADRVDAADVDLVRDTTARARDTVSLALDHLTGGDLARATALLSEVGFVQLFRVGWSLTVALARRAHALDRAGVIDPNLDALLGPRPLYSQGLDPEPTGGERPFRTVADLRVMERLVADFEKSVAEGRV
jgi:hypothetical protein